jgi:hypothetical protein
LRGFLIGLLVGIGCLSLVAYIAVHWTERQVLTTNNWVEMVAPLPQNPVVASALSDYAVAQLYSAVNVQQVIANALPPKASFLATPLSNELRTLATNTGKKVVVSDQFNQVWVTANRTLSSRLITIGRSTPNSPPAGMTVKVGKVSLNFNLSDLSKMLEQRLGSSSNGVFNTIAQQASAIHVNLESSAKQLREYFKVVDYANAVLPYLAVAALISAVAIAKRRRRVILAASVTTIVLTLFQIIGVRSLRPALLNAIKNASYRPAVNVIYSAVVHSFNDMVAVVLIGSVVVFILVAILSGPGHIAKKFKAMPLWHNLSRTTFVGYLRTGRRFITGYRLQIWGVGALLALVVLTLAANIDSTTISQVVLGYVIFMSAVQLLTLSQTRATS